MIDVITGGVENGAREQVKLGDFAGRAGVQTTAQGLQVAYLGRSLPKVGSKGRVGEIDVVVLAAKRGDVIDGMTVVTVRPAEGGELAQ